MRIFTDFPGQRAIDENIAQHEAAILSLKHQRNLLSAINHLPDEALALIFTTSKAGMTTKGAWLPLLRVCQRWRYVILGTPSFWSTISLIDSPFVSTMIERSKKMPLTLNFPLQRLRTTTTFWDATDALLQQASRIRDISISVARNSSSTSLEADIISRMAEYDLPRLHKFRLRLANGTSLFLPSSIWSLNPRFGVGLRYLELSQVLFPLENVPELPSLTTFIVRYSYVLDGLTLEWVTRFLRHTKNIEELDLQWISSASITASAGHLPITLPKLRRFLIVAHSCTGSKLFDYIEFPNCTTVYANFPNQYDVPHDLSSLERVIGRFATRSFASSVEHLCMDVTHAEAEGPEAKGLVLRLLICSSDPSLPFLDLSLPLAPVAMQLYVQLVSKLPWDLVRSFIIRTADPSLPPACSPLYQTPATVWRQSSFVSITCFNLIGVLIPADIPVLPSVTKLSVSDMPTKTLSLGWIVQFLRNTPNIEHVNLETISSENPAEVTGPLPVQLEKLTYVSIKSDSISESKIFEYLKLPFNAYITATYSSNCPDQSVDLSSLETLVTHMTTGPATMDEVYLTIWSSHGPLDLSVCSSVEEPGLAYLDLKIPFVPSSMQTYVDLISKISPLRINKLWISGLDSPALASEWSPLVRIFPNVTELTITGSVQYIPDVLLAPSSEDTSGYSNPKLQAIVAEFVSWADREGVDRAEVIEGWRNLFRKRREVGLPIHKVIIMDDTLDRDSLDGLKEYVEVEFVGETAITESVKLQGAADNEATAP